MGMLTAMYSGVAGLNVHGRALSSVADNIANLNTAAYKSTRTNFGDIMVQSLTVGGTVVSQVGTGARVLSVQNMMTQGSFENTDLPTDLAINGRGFFEVADTGNSSTAANTLYYTRAGQFTLDKEGYLVNPSGLRLQGYNVDDEGDLEQIVEDLRILTLQAAAEDTNDVQLSINLDAEDTDNHPPSQQIDPSDNDTWNYMTTVRIYDSLGIGHDLSLVFQKLESYDGTSLGSPKSVWKASIFEGTSARPPYPDNTFFLQFDTNGELLGTTQGQPGYGDTYVSNGAVTSTSSEVSDRIGETFGYSTPTGGSQTYISTVDIYPGTN